MLSDTRIVVSPTETLRARTPRNGPAAWVVVGAAAVLVAQLYRWVWRGVLVDDEGWYLLAAQAVWRGELPYRDFAFTQGPLAPYLYAPSQALAQGSVVAGRVTSALLVLALFVIAVVFVWRRVHPVAAAVLGVLLVADVATTWSLSVVKTYAACALLLVVVVAALAARSRAQVWWPVATAAAGLAATARLSAAAAWLCVLVGCLLLAPDSRTRWRTALAGLVPLAAYVPLYLAAPSGTRFGLWWYHQLTVTDAGVVARFVEVAGVRLPAIARAYDVHLVWWGAAGLMVLLSAALRRRLRAAPGTAVAALAVSGFMAANLLAGEWHDDYLVPAVPAMTLLAVLVAGVLVTRPPASGLRAGDSRWPDSNRFLPLVSATIATALVLVVKPGPDFGVDQFADRQTAMQRVARVADALVARTDPGDRVLALHGAAVVAEAGGRTVDGASLAQFSYVDTTDALARRLHVVNRRLLLEEVRQARPAAVLLSDWDVAMLHRKGTLSAEPADPTPFLRALSENYDEVLTQPGYGQGNSELTLYVRR